MINFPCQLSRIHQIVPGDGRVEVVADEPHIVVHGHFVAGVGFDITKRQGLPASPTFIAQRGWVQARDIVAGWRAARTFLSGYRDTASRGLAYRR